MSRIERDLANLTSPTMTPPIRSLTRPVHVAIVGAGMSGLRCADLLTRANARVTIFEARNRIGGRVHQTRTNNYQIDTGSNWIHGTEGNPIMKLAQRTHTLTLDPADEAAIYDSHGQRKPEAEADSLGEHLWTEISAAMSYSDQNCASIPADINLYDYLATKFQRYGSQQADLRELSRHYGQFVGNPVTQQSLKYFWLEEGLPGGNVFVAGTYGKILDEVARPALEKAEVRLNAEVKTVAYRASPEDSVKLTLMDGSEHEFDEIVTTFPLGWLKRNAAQTFTPALPNRLTRAIENVGYGALEKVYVTFPEEFWLKDGDIESFPWVSDFMNPEYHPDGASRESKTWNAGVVSLAHLPRDTAQPTLLFYIHGQCGAHLTAQLVDVERRSEKYTEIVKQFAEPYFSKLPGYDAKKKECQIIDCYATGWQQDRLAGNGGYSCFPVGLEAADDDIQCMREAGGLSQAGQGLWFAGEHTAPFAAMGTTTGAYWSGERVARGIAKMYGLTLVNDELCFDECVKDVRDASVEKEKFEIASNGRS